MGCYYLILSPELNYYGIPWRHSFLIPIALYLVACAIKGLRFGFLLQGSPSKKNTAPYQRSLALNNIGLNYLTDALTFWFYLPFFKKRKILGSIALCRFCDTLVLAPAFFYIATMKKGLYSWIFSAAIIWGMVSLATLFMVERRGSLKKFAPVFALTLLAWLTELGAAALFYFFHRGKGASGWEWGFQNLMDSFIRGPHDAYHWFYLSHFVLAFASLITMSYRKE